MLVFILISVCLVSSSFTLVLPPRNNINGKQKALLFVPASQIDTSSYLPLMRQIHAHSESSLWVGISESTFTESTKKDVLSEISNLHSNMVAQGMDDSTPLYLGGHSDGGHSLLDYIQSQNTNVKGYLLMGSFIKRAYYSANHDGHRIMTISGDLDGLVRVTRVAESFYHMVKNENDLLRMPHMIFPGFSHLSFVSGEVPANLKSQDFEAEVDQQHAVEVIASTVIAFMEMQSNSEAKEFILRVAQRSKEYLDPVIDALKLEANYALKPACYQVKSGQDCWQQNPWTRDYANSKMAALNSSYITNMNDILWPAATVFPHDYLPIVDGKCETGAFPCTLNITSVTENIYHNDTNQDLGDTPIAAFEMRAKLASRQKIWQPAGVPGADDFNFTDYGSICGEINQEALNYALSHADAEVLKRYNERGVKLQIGDDEGPYNEGPIWIWINLDYKEADSKMTVRSPAMKTPTNYWIWLSAGFHFCKLLSPAKAMEWIYYDSIKASYANPMYS